MSDFCKILIVDDEYLLRQGIKYLVDWNKEGFEIIGEASNGKEALNFIEKLKPHIIISDIVMPIMDGVDLAKVVKTKYPEIQIVILSGYSDFNYVKGTFKLGINDYILKPKLDPQEMVLLLKNTASNIPGFVMSTPENSNTLNISNLLTKLISGFYSGLDEKILDNTFSLDSFLLIGDNIKKINNITSMSLLSLRSILSKAAKIYLKDLIYFEVEAENNFFLLVINLKAENYSEVIARINLMLLEVSKDIPEIFFVISNLFNSLYKLEDIYINNFKPLLGYKFYFKGKTLITYALLPKNSLKEKFDFKYYSGQIYTLNLDNALIYLKEYLCLSIKNISINEFELKTLFENALYNIINILDELNFNMEEMDNSKLEYFQRIDETKSPDELLNLLDIITKDTKSILNNDESKLNDHMINKIIEYISNHYYEQLSLKQVADKFHFNYYYLSSYFSSHNAEGFSEYLNKIRLEKAVELLGNEKIPVSEVSFMVGYSDHSYFCKVFKKFKKLTPSKFRRNILDNKRG
ncbi:response regulator transcription factor [Clostridium estertheticum]|uniref:response regulator transcription factor n=1 Tax=Clostridium estertheticum TaxID=238834 RepID=UPI001C7DEBCB|nr:response regulator [Clostridium estertheticum]MBX4270733.1 response regulator [Clostridium estertheticum]WLC78581.1 response regulator [Clostridium estertheticum]